MLYVVHVRCSGPVGARSSLYRLEAMAPALIRSNSAWLFTARSLNSSMSLLPSVVASKSARYALQASLVSTLRPFRPPFSAFQLLASVRRPCSTTNHSLRAPQLRPNHLLAVRYQADRL